MELEENSLDGHWTKDEKGCPQFFIINEAIISKLCVLGEDIEPCFEGATIGKVQFTLDADFKQKLYELMNEVKNNEGGITSVEKELNKNDDVTTEEIETVEEPVEASATDSVVKEEVETPSNDDAMYALQKNFDELKTKFDALQIAYDSLEAFKANIDKKEKQEMIDRFYMLTDEQKKNVVDNIDKYSVQDIEKELAVICFRNGINFAPEEETKDESHSNTFSLDSATNDDESIPEWLKVALATKEDIDNN